MSAEDAPITRKGDADFITLLLLKLAAQSDHARIGKFVIQRPSEDVGSLQTYLVLRDDWLSERTECLKVHDVLPFSLDLCEMYQYRTHDAIAIEKHIPFDWVLGFQWANEKEHAKFFNIHAFKEPN